MNQLANHPFPFFGFLVPVVLDTDEKRDKAEKKTEILPAKKERLEKKKREKKERQQKETEENQIDEKKDELKKRRVERGGGGNPIEG